MDNDERLKHLTRIQECIVKLQTGEYNFEEFMFELPPTTTVEDFKVASESIRPYTLLMRRIGGR